MYRVLWEAERLIPGLSLPSLSLSYPFPAIRFLLLTSSLLPPFLLLTGGAHVRCREKFQLHRSSAKRSPIFAAHSLNRLPDVASANWWLHFYFIFIIVAYRVIPCLGGGTSVPSDPPEEEKKNSNISNGATGVGLRSHCDKVPGAVRQ